MFNNLTIKNLLMAYGLISVALVFSVGAVGYIGTTTVSNGMEKIVDTQLSVRRQLDADMMHDAVRADAFAAVIASHDGHADQEQAIIKDVTEHVERMKKSMGQNAALPLGDKVGRQIAKVSPMIDTYSDRARSIIKDAFHNPAEVAQSMSAFLNEFSMLETEMAQLSDLIAALTEQTKVSVDQSTHNQKTTIAILSLIALFLLLSIAVYVVRKVTIPLSQLAHVVTKIEQTGDLSLRAVALGKNEISQTVNAFNALINTMQHIVKEVHANVAQVATAISELAAADSALEAASIEQGESVATIAANVEEVSTSIDQVAENAGIAEKISAGARTDSARGHQVVNDTLAEITQISDSVTVASQQIAILSTRSDEISGIVKVIKEIADQTNLLALNAAIEAARAGEQGRGFAVVADEVRKLAERTGTATIEISGLISAIQQETGNAVQKMEASKNHAKRGLQLASEAGKALDDISTGTNNSAIHAKETALATKEQSSAVQEIAAALEKIAQLSDKSSQSIASTAQVAHNLDRLASNLKTAARRFKT